MNCSVAASSVNFDKLGPLIGRLVKSFDYIEPINGANMPRRVLQFIEMIAHGRSPK